MTPQSIINCNAALKRLGGDKRLLRELASLYLVDMPDIICSLHAGISAQDQTESIRLAHNARGLASNFEAVQCVEAAKCIEQAAVSGDFAKASADLALLVRAHTEAAMAMRQELNV